MGKRGRSNGRGGGGGGGRGRGGRCGRGGGQRSGRDTRDERVSFDKLEKKNVKFEKYYNELLWNHHVPATTTTTTGEETEGQEAEMSPEQIAFWAALRRELPNSFRFCGSRGHALAVQKLFKTRYIPELASLTLPEGQPVDAPQAAPWYPDSLAWWMTTPKNIIRKYDPFRHFQRFLVSETGVGNISRQELVSMIPPLVMDLRPGMTVLDMCAAPGSKAAQLLEMVHQGEEGRIYRRRARAEKDADQDMTEDNDEEDNGDDGRATGLLIANDSDYKRSHMLIHQLKRLSSPNLIVTNHDATIYPSIKLPPTKENPATNRYLKFDRILADVPCSGDGTTRKNVNLWKDWTPGNAIGLHVTQTRILVRAIQMLKAGGRVVYSTCSMNPLENEAIIISAIQKCGGTKNVELVESKELLPDLKRNPGLRKWRVMDRTGAMWDSRAQVDAHIAENGTSPAIERLESSLFAPVEGSDEANIPLERCMRVYAHQQNTGAFFIAILEKKSEIKVRVDKDPKDTGSTAISSIVDEINGQSNDTVAPKIEAADSVVAPVVEQEPSEMTPAARQNQEQPYSDATAGTKRGIEDVDEQMLDGIGMSKKLRTKEVVDNPDPPGRTEHFPPPPGAVLDASVRPGDQRTTTKARGNVQFEEPFKYLSPDHTEIASISNFYQLDARFPLDRFLVRNAQAEPAKIIYYTSDLVRSILRENEGKGIKFVHGGVKMFMRQDVQAEKVCKWRIQSEGMPILHGYVGEDRIIRCSKRGALSKLLKEMFPKVSDDGWQSLGEIGEKLKDSPMGCFVLRCETSAAEDGFEEPMVMPIWRSMHSVNLMMAKEERSALLLRLFNDTSELVNNSKGMQKKADAARADATREDDSDEEDLAKAQAEINTDDAIKIPVEHADGEVDLTRIDGEQDAQLNKDVAPGFKYENGEVHVDTNNSIEAANQVVGRDEAYLDKPEVHPGPYSDVIVDGDAKGALDPGADVKMQQIKKGEDTGCVGGGWDA